MISFIHIGKCGGSTIYTMLKSKFSKYKEYHLIKDYTSTEKYILWIRNPLARFVSAFNHSYTAVNYTFTKEDIPRIKLNNCIVPCRIKDKLKSNRPFLYSVEYDSLVNLFKTANALAEGLSSENETIKRKALQLMNSPIEHINKGIGWYLNNGKFVKNRYSKILFVGKLETINEDIKSLESILHCKFNTNTHLRENKNSSMESKYLSPLAIKNLLEFYKNTDYAALKALYESGWITKEVLDSYYEYKL
jgi:hypothetical protein